MDKYKVILVDDEAEVIDVIEQKIAWNELGFEVVGSATNGVKALELVEKTQPDVVITDIKNAIYGWTSAFRDSERKISGEGGCHLFWIQ